MIIIYVFMKNSKATSARGDIGIPMELVKFYYKIVFLFKKIFVYLLCNF